MQSHHFWIPVGGRFISRLLFAVVLGCCHSSHAQWITQTNQLKPGWNSVYLHVDASYTNANSLLLANPSIEEAWMWTADLPPGLTLATPPGPIPGSQWVKWVRSDLPNSTLQTLPGNAALLIKTASAAAPSAWNVKGRPVPPSYRWTLSGLNFVGFTTVAPAPFFDAFLRPDAQALDWAQSVEIFRYQGGNLGPTNPVQVSAILQRNVQVMREQAYWIRAGEPTNQLYNHYFGPFQVTGVDAAGLRFGDSQGQSRLYLKNMSKSNLTVTLQEVRSEAPPTGPVPSLLPLMVRGSLVTSNLTFSYSSLTNGPSSWTLAPFGQPGSEAEIVLGVDRSLMGAAGGITFAGILRFTDSFGLTRVDIGASATTPSRAGLWVGDAQVDQVSQYLKPYVKFTNVAQFHQKLNDLGLTVGGSGIPVAVGPDGRRYEWDTNTGRILVFGGPENSKGQYLPAGPTVLTPAYTAQPFPLRLIVHHDGINAKLMQRAYLGRDRSSNVVVATRQAALDPADLANARRISAVHLPTSDVMNSWDCAGSMETSLTANVNLAYWDQASNPFLHTYHPDHDNIDNRDDTFQTPLGGGKESFDIQRVLRLTFTPPGPDFDSRSRGGTRLSGNYSETISVLANSTVLKQFNVLGTFALTRINDTAILVTQ